MYAPMAMAMDVVLVTMPTDRRIIVGRPQARMGPFMLGSSGPGYLLLTLS